MKLTAKKLTGTIRGRMSRKEYWAHRKELRHAYKKQLMELARETQKHG